MVWQAFWDGECILLLAEFQNGQRWIVAACRATLRDRLSHLAVL
jgi:hypothetical protein